MAGRFLRRCHRSRSLLVRGTRGWPQGWLVLPPAVPFFLERGQPSAPPDLSPQSAVPSGREAGRNGCAPSERTPSPLLLAVFWGGPARNARAPDYTIMRDRTRRGNSPIASFERGAGRRAERLGRFHYLAPESCVWRPARQWPRSYVGMYVGSAHSRPLRNV